MATDLGRCFFSFFSSSFCTLMFWLLDLIFFNFVKKSTTFLFWFSSLDDKPFIVSPCSFGLTDVPRGPALQFFSFFNLHSPLFTPFARKHVLPMMTTHAIWNRRVHFTEKNFRMSSGVSEQANEWAQWSTRAKQAVRSKQMSERCERTSERTSEWPKTLCVYSLIIRLIVRYQASRRFPLRSSSSYLHQGVSSFCLTSIYQFLLGTNLFNEILSLLTYFLSFVLSFSSLSSWQEFESVQMLKRIKAFLSFWLIVIGISVCSLCIL